jgi:uncharacterized membrane protein
MQAEVLGCFVAIVWLLALDGIWLFIGGAKENFTEMAQSFLGHVKPWKPWQGSLFLLGAYGLLAALVCDVVLSRRHPAGAAARGAFIGLAVYGVFDLTNLMLFGRGYGASLAFSDVFWGTCLLGSSSLVGTVARNAAAY